MSNTQDLVDFLKEANSNSSLKVFYDRYASKYAKGELIEVTPSDNSFILAIYKELTEYAAPEVVYYNVKTDEVLFQTGELQKVDDRCIELVKETSLEETWRRVAREVAKGDGMGGSKKEKEALFYEFLSTKKLVPGGRILYGAGDQNRVTLLNCFVIASPKDTRGGIYESLSEWTELMSRGGGVGINISTLRPRGSKVLGVGGRSSGAVSWLEMFSQATGIVEQGGSRRGAAMGILEVWHPDIYEFIERKKNPAYLTNMNISVGVTDDFMEAVEKDLTWTLRFPDTSHEKYDSEWDGDLKKWVDSGLPVTEWTQVPARSLWRVICESAWASAEPGLFFIDRANKLSNSQHYNRIVATNPCGEIPLGPYGVCCLSHINLSEFVLDPFTDRAEVDWQSLGKAVEAGVYFLDNVISIEQGHIPQVQKMIKNERRVGLGTLGLADMLIKLGIRYGSPEAVELAEDVFECITTTAYMTSIDACRPGNYQVSCYPNCNKQVNPGSFLDKILSALPSCYRDCYEQYGMRNVCLITQAPTGTGGMLVGASTGIEPHYQFEWTRRSRIGELQERANIVNQYYKYKGREVPLPDYFVHSMQLTVDEHVAMMAVAQKWNDMAISKTVNMPKSSTVEDVENLYMKMYKLGCKGGTIYRDGSREVQVLYTKENDKEQEQEKPNQNLNTSVMRDKPRTRKANIISIPTGSGTLHVTLSQDDKGMPLEVFVDVGKGGSDVKAFAEAMGRLISLVLRINGVTPGERLEEVIRQLEHIGGSRPTGFGPKRTKSLPDAISRALRELSTEEKLTTSLFQELNEVVDAAFDPKSGPGHVDTCPSCGDVSLVSFDGCSSCPCGHTEC